MGGQTGGMPVIGGGGRGRGWRRALAMHGAHAGPGGPGGRFIEPFLLLLLAQGPSHGYDLLERLTARGFVAGEVDPGYLYRTLRGMEAAGAVSSEWDSASRGPIKRTYALTAEGENAGHGWAA